VLLLSREGDKVAGSGRTWGRTPLYERLAPVARRFTNEFGGHSAALGVALPAERFEEFRDAVREAFSTFRDEDEWAEELHVDSLLTGPEVDLPLTKALQRFEPHGQQNPKPLFLFRNLGWDGRGKAVGESGLRVVFRDGSVPLPGVGWNLAEPRPGDRPPRVDVANVALDTFWRPRAHRARDFGGGAIGRRRERGTRRSCGGSSTSLSSERSSRSWCPTNGRRCGPCPRDDVAPTLVEEAEELKDRVRFRGFAYRRPAPTRGTYVLRADEAIGFREEGNQVFR
jgi:hypothetical protein